MPAAIAPLETSTTSRPMRRSSAICAGPARERLEVEPAALVGDEARADLDDDALRFFEDG